MGNSKSKKLNTTSRVGKEFACPLCNKIFDAKTTFNQVY